MSERALAPGCETVEPELGAFVDGELAPDERGRIERHLETCNACRAEAALLRMMTESLRLVERPEPSEGMRQRLLAQVQAEGTPRTLEVVCHERHGQEIREWREVRRARSVWRGRRPSRSGPPAPGPSPGSGSRRRSAGAAGRSSPFGIRSRERTDRRG